MNFNLRFPDEQTAIKLMPQYRGSQFDDLPYIDTATGLEIARKDDGRWLLASHDHALDPIGTLYAPTGEKTSEGDDAMAAIDGWHCNLVCGELPEELKEFEVFPVNPKMVWG